MYPGSESAGFQEGSGDVVGQVPKAQCGASEVFEAAVDRFGRSVAGAGSVEVGQDIGSRFFSVRPRVMSSWRGLGTPVLSEAISVAIMVRVCPQFG